MQQQILKVLLSQQQRNLAQTQQYTEVFDQLQAHNVKQLECITIIRENIETFDQLHQQYKGKLDHFKALEKVISHRLFEETKDTLHREVAKVIQTTNEYQALEKKLSSIASSIEQAKNTFTKLLEVTKNLKATDFELVGIAKELRTGDQEKLRLTRENEKLKHLIAKNRQRLH